MRETASCPTVQELAAWSIGRCLVERIEGIADHLEVCDECESSLDLLKEPADSQVLVFA